MRHAGFAAAIVARQQMIQDLIRVLYQAGPIRHTLSGRNRIPLPDGGAIDLETDFFVDVPTLTLSTANGNQVQLDLRGWGPITVTLPGRAAETRPVIFSLRVLATPQLTLAASLLTINVDPGTVTISGRPRFDVLRGAPFSRAVRAFLDSDGFRTLIQLGIRLQLASQPLAPFLSVGFLGGIGGATGAAITPRVLDGALAIGLDVTGGGISTTGNPDELGDFTEGEDLAMWINPVAAPIAFREVVDRVRTQVVERAEATLDRFAITIEEGHLLIAGAASRAEGSAEFSMRAIPRLFRPGRVVDEGDDEYGEHWTIRTPDREELWFEMVDLRVTVERAFWVDLVEVLGAIFLGLGPIMVESLVAGFRTEITGHIRASSDTSQAARTQEFTLPGTSEPMIRVRIEHYRSHGEGLFSALTVRPQFWAARLETPSAMDASDFMDVERSTLVSRVRLPFGVLQEDPQLRVDWTLRRTDTNEVIHRMSSTALDGTVHPVNVLSARSSPGFLVSCRLYRQLSSSEELFTASGTVVVLDRLDRSHPYVRWRHDVITPNVRVELDGTRTLMGYDELERISAIHRTAVPGRCLMATRYSPRVIRRPYGRPAYSTLEYLDELPFPLTDLMTRRSEVCDYCFFGGPTRTVPLIPIT